MKVPLSWLKEYVDITIPLPELVDRLTLAGLEVISIKLIGVEKPPGLKTKLEEEGPVWDREKIITGKVLEVSKVPETDKLKFVKLDIGKGEPKTVITGAGNIQPGDSGMVVALAFAGAKLFDGYSDKKEIKELKPKPIRGFPSDSMVCSARELGIADEHEGIILMDESTPVAVPLVEVLGDVIIEVDVLPNMARCLSILGVARELAAIMDQPLKKPSFSSTRTTSRIDGQVSVSIPDPRQSRRYTATLIKNVTCQPSPTWMKQRLTASGMRPINVLVDVTNYVMLELGQPLHAFDWDKLHARSLGKPPEISVRLARSGETLKTLDGQERKLQPHHLLIADVKGPIALAGVMGGFDTEVSESTKNILLESAHFDQVAIRKAAREFDLHSEASARFSRGIHPELSAKGAERAAELLRTLAGGTISAGTIDMYPAPLQSKPVMLPMMYVHRLLGMSIPVDQAARILRSLEFGVDAQGTGDDAVLLVSMPDHRTDIQHGPADLVEDIARIYGYDKLPTTMLSDRLPRQENNLDLQNEEAVRDLLVNLGLQEVLTYSLTSPERELPILGQTENYIRLANPIVSDRCVMRQSLLASVLEIAANNLRHRNTVQLFEVGKVFLPQSDPLPRETRRLAIVMSGQRDVAHWSITEKKDETLDFFNLKGIIESLLSGLHLTKVQYQTSKAAYLHPGQTAEVCVEGNTIGQFGRLHPKLNEEYQLGKRNVIVADLNLEILFSLVTARHQVQSISPYPPVLQDVALVVDDNLSCDKVTSEIWAGGAGYLSQVRLFDVFRGGSLPEGKKSLAFALTYQSQDRVLNDKEVAKVHAKIVNRCERLLGAALRS